MGFIEELDKRQKEYELELLSKWTDFTKAKIKPNAPKGILEKAKRYDDYVMEKHGHHAYRNFVEPENLKEWDKVRLKLDELGKDLAAGCKYSEDGIAIIST
ncbi:MAG: hypothetical protein Q4D98_01305 [Planctomycetia bacterium]|nr:hypothetical protein [Planctomycetia bacterium]